jgi:signal transduction histidine kinase/ligand-binding sensor domain-containing protein
MFGLIQVSPGVVRRGIAVAVCISAATPSGFSRAVELPPTRWASRAWELNDLIPGEGAGGSVRGIVQEPDSTLVIATTVGLVRFDGDAFTPIPLRLPPGEQPHVLHVARARSGPSAGVLASGRLFWLDDDNGRRSVAPPPDEAGVAATSLAIDQLGRAWIANERGGIWRVNPDGERHVVAAGTVAPAGRAHLTVAADGTIWATVNKSLAIVRDDRLEQVATIPGGLSVVAAADGGGVWLTVRSELFRYQSDGIGQAVVPAAATFSAPPIEDVIGTVRGLSVDTEGRLWLCSSRYGLFVLEKGVLTQVDVGETWVTTAILDREGSVWAGTRLAIHRIRPAIAWPTSLPTWRPIIDLASNGQGRTWCLTQNGEVGAWPDDHPEDFTLSPETLATELGRERALCLDVTSTGAVWVASAGGRLHRIDHDGGSSTTVSLPPPHDNATITGLLAAPSDDLWVMTDSTLLRRRNEDWHVVTIPANAPASADPKTTEHGNRIESHLAADSTTAVWIVADTLIGRVSPDDDTLQLIPTAAIGTARPGRIVAAAGDRLWIVLKSTGLARWHDSRWSVVTPAHGLASEDIVGTVIDNQGRLWCATPRMLFVVDTEELERVADGAADRCHCWVLPPRYETDFLESLATPTCAMLEIADGRLLVARQSGLVICDPGRLPVVPAPMVTVRGVTSNQMVRFTPPSAAKGAEAILPPAPRRVEISFAAATLLAPLNATVEYRLDGIDSAWIPAPLHGSASYSSLPSGVHPFRLRSSTPVAPWAPSEPALTIMVDQPVWETWWFRSIALATAAGLAASGAAVVATRRHRRRVEALRQQTAVDNERMRLARDMHDEVGTNLTQIALLTEIALGDATPAHAEHLETVARISRQTVTALDELVWAVDPGNDTLNHLLSYVCRYATETLREFGIACDVERPSELPTVSTPGQFRRGVLLIVKETITNIVAHARPRSVIVRLECTDDRLRLTVSDDGIGCDGTTTNGSGLANMRHRAAALGGECRIGPGGDGAGTAVELDVPLAGFPERFV